MKERFPDISLDVSVSPKMKERFPDISLDVSV
jgi:hypothetical protein